MGQTAQKRENFPNRKGWKVSKNGNRYIKVNGFHCIAAREGQKFKIGIKHSLDTDHTWGDQRYDSLTNAQMGCVDAINYMRTKKNLKQKQA